MPHYADLLFSTIAPYDGPFRNMAPLKAYQNIDAGRSIGFISEMDVARIRDVIIEENSTAPSITWSTSGNLSPDFGQFRVTIFHKNKKSQVFVVKTPQVSYIIYFL